MEKDFSNYNTAKNILNNLRNYQYAVVEKIRIRKIKINSPEGLKTSTLLKMGSSILKIVPKRISNYAQDLYMRGLISYPRTGTTKYSILLDFKNSLKMFINDESFGKDVKNLLLNFDSLNLDYSKGQEKGGHQPIFPLKYYNHEENLEFTLDEVEEKLYNLICLYYFASLSPPLKYELKKYILKVGDYFFIGSSSKIIEEGFLVFQSYKRNDYIIEFPSLKENKRYQIFNFGIEEKNTEPPDYLTESELIDKMEEFKIGNEGYISSLIENLYLRHYVKVDKERRLIPSKLGEALIDTLNIIDPELIRPENIEKIEEIINQIETEGKEYKNILEEVILFYKNKFIKCSSKIDELKKEFWKRFKLII